MTPEIKHAMAFMNCPWKSTAGCNFICETCLHSDSDGFRTLLDDINRLGRHSLDAAAQAAERSK